MNKVGFREINLPVGARLQMTVKTGTDQNVYYTELIGYLDYQFLIIKIPFEQNAMMPLAEGQQLSFRIFSGVDIFTFSCIVKDVVGAPYHYAHLSFPNDVEQTPLRRSIRAKADFSVQINSTPKAATIVDISVLGAGIMAKQKLGEIGQDLLIYFYCPVSLMAQDVPIKTTVKICNIQQQPAKQDDPKPKWLHGVVFRDLSSTNKIILQNFIYESLSHKN